jgi:hypothetical protein
VDLFCGSLIFSILRDLFEGIEIKYFPEFQICKIFSWISYSRLRQVLDDENIRSI